MNKKPRGKSMSSIVIKIKMNSMALQSKFSLKSFLRNDVNDFGVVYQDGPCDFLLVLLIFEYRLEI